MHLQQEHQRSVWPSDFWKWSAPIVVATLIALMLYATLYSLLIPPFSDEALEMMEAWRLAGLNFVYYLPICLAQWFVLRQHVHHAFWWVLATMGAVSIIQPSVVAILWELDHDMLAFSAWIFGMGSGVFAAISQWLVLRHWTTRSTQWLGLIPVVWILVLVVSHVVGWLIPYTYTKYLSLAFWGLYQVILGIVLLYVLSGEQSGRVDKVREA